MADPPEPGPAAEEEPRQLDVVERWFQTVITHPEGVDEGVDSSEAQQLIRLGRNQLEQVILRSKSLTARERLSIYANAYYARLVECLGECFPIFKKALGEEVFSGFALESLQRYPLAELYAGSARRSFQPFSPGDAPRSQRRWLPTG